MKIHIVKQKDVEKLVSMEMAIKALSQIFLQHDLVQLTAPNRMIIKLHEKGKLALIMPSYSSVSGLLGVKLSSIIPSNLQHKLPLIHSVILLLDENDGQIKALIDGRAVTMLRTGAICGLATQLLASKTAANLAIIGAGQQSYSIVKAMCSVRKISKVYLYSRTSQKTYLLQKFIHEVLNVPHVIVADNSSEAIREADIICTATSNDTRQPVINFKDIPRDKEIFINAIGGSNLQAFELPIEIYASANIIVEDVAVSSSECGEISYGIANKMISKPDLIPLGRVMKHKLPLNHKITIFRSVGMAIEDLAIIQEIFNSTYLNKLCSIITLD